MGGAREGGTGKRRSVLIGVGVQWGGREVDREGGGALLEMGGRAFLGRKEIWWEGGRVGLSRKGRGRVWVVGWAYNGKGGGLLGKGDGCSVRE